MKYTYPKKYKLFIFSVLITLGTLSFNSAYASEASGLNTETTANTPAISPTTPQITSHDKDNNHKQYDVNEKRELSAFFKVGLGINFVMLVVFIYWAVGQWRQNKK
ncbi:MAG: hypothetical protein OEY43_06485 [Gammaproteobacteria bacterium]|nr:hypothetical protein [Gammaproteobacteria bacterium]